MGAKLLVLRDGGPPVHLRRLEVSSPISVEGGRLEALNCEFSGSGGVSVPGLSVSGGEARIILGHFTGYTAGAAAVAKGSLELDDCEFRHNRAVRGGALHVSGGHATVARTLFSENTAVEAGGALFVEGGYFGLKNHSLMLSNSAPVGSSMVLTEGGQLSYELPAPLGRFIFTSSALLHQSVGATNEDYPFSCPGGSMEIHFPCRRRPARRAQACVRRGLHAPEPPYDRKSVLLATIARRGVPRLDLALPALTATSRASRVPLSACWYLLATGPAQARLLQAAAVVLRFTAQAKAALSRQWCSWGAFQHR